MQNKGLIRFFAILFAVVCIYQLSFTFVTNKVKKDAVAFSGGDRAKELAYLDSIKKEPVYPIFGYNFEEVQEKQINKGLDLEGGINVTLQISVKDIIKGLANNSQNPVFVKALSETEKIRKAQESSFDAFIRAFDIANKEAGGTTRLASPDIFANRNFDEKEININSTDDEVKKVLLKKVDESVESAFQIIRERIDKFGVAQPNIQKIGNTGRILVELPGAKDEVRIKKLLQSTAQLEFWEVYKMEEIGNFIMAANQELKKQAQPKKEETTTDTDSISKLKSDIEALLTDKADTESLSVGPIIDKMAAFGGGQVLGYYALKDTAEIAGYFRDAHIRGLLSPEQRYAKFLWSKPTTQYVLDKQLVRSTEAKAVKMEVVELYAIKGNRENKAALVGGVVVDARSDFDQFGKPAVSMRMNSNGAKEWEKLTREVAARQGAVAIVLDDQVYSAPNVNEAISGGNSSISGNFKLEETTDLANILKAGKLPASADIIQSAVVGPSLGEQAIQNGVISFIIGFIIVLLWMIIYYGRTGMYANIALLVNLLFIFGVLASLGAVLTLPGIAGIVFIIGTAIDANIIINERVKEELRAGKTIKEAVDHAFSWNGALSSIFDANITTALVGIILFIFGSGPIQGFATTLIIGIATSLFTAIFIPMLFIYSKVDKGENIKFSTKLTENWFVGTNYNFLGKRKLAYAVSIIAVIISFVSLSTKGLNPGVDFVGGRTYQVKFAQDVNANEVKDKLVTVFGSAEAKTYGAANQLRITTKYKVENESTEVDNEINHMLYDNLKEFLPSEMTFDQFMSSYDNKTIGVLETSKVGPTIADDLKYDALKAVLGAFIIMFIYILISFRRWQFSLGAVVGLVQNVIIVLGVYSLTYTIMPFNMELDQHLIAALLTVVGFSINDTVIVFDRVREFLRLRRTEETGESFTDTVNLALNTTLSRTINTSLSLTIVLLAVFIFGGESLRGFIFAMLIGIVVGTFTSIFIATPIMADTMIKSGADKIIPQEDETTTATEIENA